MSPGATGRWPARARGVGAGLAGVAGPSALVVSDLTNVRWLTGFTGSNGWVVVDDLGHVTLVTDGRYGQQAERQLAAAGFDEHTATISVGANGPRLHELIAAAVTDHATVGFEAAHTSFAQYQQWCELFGGAHRLAPTTGTVERSRRAKDDHEIAAIAEACRIADQALAEVAPHLADGLTEADVRNRLEIRMRELGASGPSYETIVATGPRNAPLPHHRPTNTLIETGHTVIIDVGALVDGYHSDMTRTFVIGQPTALQREVYDVVRAAQQAGVNAVRPGIAAAQLDSVCRSIIADAGFGPWFSHGTGHGVGLLIHEDPFINAASTMELQVGDVVTVEPGVYREDLGGVRIEDLVVVTSDGCRVLTQSPKDSPCLPSPPTT
jgi:Xaa-Pro aminopeptidase